MRFQLFVLLLALSSACFAEPGKLDTHGCHQGKKDFHCHKGKLKGRKFASIDDAAKYFSEEAKDAAAPDQATLDKFSSINSDPKVLKVISWNVKHLGRSGFNISAATGVLIGADIVTFQEVNKSSSGQWTILALRDRLQEITKEKICAGLSEIPTQGKERYGYLWKNDRVSYVKTNGDIMEECDRSAITIRLGVKNAEKIVREPAFGTFYFKSIKRKFVLASVHLVPTSKSPQKEVEPLFDTFKEVTQPVIVAGDFNLDSVHPSFESARKLSFQPVLLSVPTSLKAKKRELNKPYDNFWIRRLKTLSFHVRNLYEAFPGMDKSEIFNHISDHSPIFGEFEMDAETTN